MFDRICRENSISHRLTAPRSPTTTGKIERFHQSLRKEFLADRTFKDLATAQAALDAWVTDYNNERPHQALEMATPAERFRLVPIAKDALSVPVYSAEEQQGQSVLRRCGSNGFIFVDNQMFSIRNAYRRQLLEAFVDDTTIQVWFQNHLVKPSLTAGRASCERSELMGYTSTFRRSQKDAHQPELDTLHQDHKSP
ncbi:MAG TPA: integrase core domain-containing protein [Actinomycetota bacterium]|nr:integrase core domain-containing protein [Actinomycetota bacterium]